ncbi:MAG: hypothetical protein ACO3TX_08510, partial [Pseudomonadales bacterium]
WLTASIPDARSDRSAELTGDSTFFRPFLRIPPESDPSGTGQRQRLLHFGTFHPARLSLEPSLRDDG